MASRGAPRSAGRSADADDVFELLPSGKVHLAWGPYDVMLRTPLVGEYATYIEQNEADQPWFEAEGRTSSELWGPANPNLVLWRRIILELAGVDVEEARLPAWMLASNAFVRLVGNWRVNPLARGERPEVENLVTALMQSAGVSSSSPNSTAPDGVSTPTPPT